jgi:ribosomal protein L21
MLDNNFMASQMEATQYSVIPEDVYQVELLEITAKEVMVKDPKKGDHFETKLSFQYVLLNGQDNGESLRGRSVWANFVPSYLYISLKNGKNKLYKVVESLLGRQLTQEEILGGLSGPFFNGLIGKQCRVGIEHTVKGEKTYANPETWYKADSLLTALSAEEKEKATVKKKDGSVSVQTEEEKPKIDPKDIPF